MYSMLITNKAITEYFSFIYQYQSGIEYRNIFNFIDEKLSLRGLIN